MSIDTTFLIDLQCERNSGVEGPAHALLAEDPEVAAGFRKVPGLELAAYRG